jgi:hypothetical protein
MRSAEFHPHVFDRGRVHASEGGEHISSKILVEISKL